MTASMGLVTELYRWITWHHIVVVVGVAYLIKYLCVVAKARVTLPSGPFPYPIVGNPLGKIAHVSLTKLAKKYGDIMTVFIGSRPVVVISGATRIRECLLKHSSAFAGKQIYFDILYKCKSTGCLSNLLLISTCSICLPLI